MIYRFKTIYVFLFFMLVLCSCTKWQWRFSDEKIQNSFKALNIETEINYFSVDSLDRTIRVQSIKIANSDVNVVFLHGSPSSLSAWNAYLKDTLLVSKVNMHSIDRPGYGYSDFGEELIPIKLQAKVLSALINDFKLKNVIAVGSSYGGPLASRLAVINSNVKAIMMISPAIDPKQEKHVKGQKFTQFWLTRWLVPTGYRIAGDEKETHSEELTTLQSDWNKVKVPVIHIHGDKDNLVPHGNVNYTKEMFNNFEIITTPNTGHEIAWGRSELIKPHLMKLIMQIEKETKQ